VSGSTDPIAVFRPLDFPRLGIWYRVEVDLRTGERTIRPEGDDDASDGS
jgi:hypothetical protein